MGYVSFCHIVSKVSKVTICHIVIFGITGPNFIKFAQNVDKILPFIIFRPSKLELRYSNPFWNGTMANDGWFANFAIKLVAMARPRPLGDLRTGSGQSRTNKGLPFGEKSRKLVQ